MGSIAIVFCYFMGASGLVAEMGPQGAAALSTFKVGGCGRAGASTGHVFAVGNIQRGTLLPEGLAWKRVAGVLLFSSQAGSALDCVMLPLQ